MHAKSRWVRRSTLFVVAAAVAIIASAGVLSAFAQAAQMDPPTMTPAIGATVEVSWLPVAPVGANDTTYTLSYDTTYPFTATQTVQTIGTSFTIHGANGVTYYAVVQADDGSGVLSDPSGVGQATADGVAPSSALVASPASPNGDNGWYTSAPTASITVQDTGSGLQSLVVNAADVSADMIFGLPPDPSTYALTLSEGVNDLVFFGTDVAGNIETPAKTASIKLDSVAPTCTLSVSSNGPTNVAITADVAAGDASPGSGVDRLQYVFLPRGTTPSGSTTWVTVAGASASPVVPQGRLTLFARSFDGAGNVSALQQADVFFDSAAPVTTIVTDPASPTGPDGTWLRAPGIVLHVTDVAPGVITMYSWDDTDTVATVGTAPVVPAGPGSYTLRFLSVDSAGNREDTHTVTFTVLLTYDIVPSAGSHGAISPDTTQSVPAGSDATFTITPASGYRVNDVLVDDVSVGAVTSYTFHGVEASHTISATFVAKTATKLSIYARHASVTHGHSDYLHGYISPRMASGTHVGFYVQKPGSHTWIRVSTRHTFSGHKWSYTYRLASRGTYHFQVRFGATSVFAGSTSRTISVRAR